MGKTGAAAANDWRFNSESYPDSQRGDAWRKAVGRLGLSVASNDVDVGLYGTVTSRASPLGVIFAKVASGAQRFERQPVRGDETILLVQHLDGEATLGNGTAARKLAAGDLILSSGDAKFSLSFASPFRQLLIRVPRVAVSARMLSLNSGHVAWISGGKGLGHVFSQLLSSIADTLETLEVDDMRPIDLALSEFLVASLADDSSTGERGATRIQAAVLHRTCQKLEARLSDPDLTLASVAQEEDLSPRYLQKLFESAGESFTQYLRHRRLERCRADLENPLLDTLSISDIGFRWGFNDAGHFSRAFRDHFNISPREYRQDAAQRLSQGELHPVNRGWPHAAITQKRQRASFPEAGEADVLALFKRAPGHDARADSATRHVLRANDKTVHWGYFSRALPPVLEIASGDIVTIEAVTQHAADDYDRMIKDDPGLESIYHWTKAGKNVDRRGAGPMDASIYGRGAGEGFGVHIMTGPIAVKDAKPGDVLEVRILDVLPRPSANPKFADCCFGSNAATWWGFHYNDLLTEPKPREVVTLYEFDLGGPRPCAHAVYNYRWTPQTDPSGVLHPTIDYPGVPVDHATVEKNHDVLKDISIPVRPHFGVIGVAPREAELLDSVPPSYFGGNIDNWRVGKGATIYLPVSVPGALLSVGDPHASQGDSELCGTAIECSLTGVFQIVLHKRANLAGRAFADLSYPLIETKDEWVLLGFSHPNYLAELGEKAQSDIYEKSSLDLAMKDAFRKMRRFLMTTHNLSEDEAISLMSVAVDFGVTQVVDGNWGVHAILRKALFDRR